MFGFLELSDRQDYNPQKVLNYIYKLLYFWIGNLYLMALLKTLLSSKYKLLSIYTILVYSNSLLYNATLSLNKY